MRRKGPEVPLHPLKCRVIDRAFDRCEVRSFADLGGVWGVDGGYTFFALERFPVDRAALVDEEHTQPVRTRARRFPQLELVSANFGAVETVRALGQLDVVLLFDVLLHQVAPDWDEVLELYAPQTNAFAIVNPQWADGDDAIRLVELGREEYLRSVPPLALHDELFEHLHETNPCRGRPWRDVHDVWQWGIPDAALRSTMERLGFSLAYYEDAGPWQRLDHFRSRAFLFVEGDG